MTRGRTCPANSSAPRNKLLGRGAFPSTALFWPRLRTEGDQVGAGIGGRVLRKAGEGWVTLVIQQPSAQSMHVLLLGATGSSLA